VTDYNLPPARLIPLGKLFITSNACEVLSHNDILRALRRHAHGDWGDLDAEDRRSNDLASMNGDRLLSAYRSKEDRKFWIITEWDRSATTVLLPEDY